MTSKETEIKKTEAKKTKAPAKKAKTVAKVAKTTKTVKAKKKEVVSATNDLKVLDVEEAVELNLDLESSIDKLIAEKESIIRPDAIEAKENFDTIQTRTTEPTPQKSLPRTGIDGFSENLEILTEVFRKSRFDEYLVLLSNPQRVLGINFLLGIFRGMGFAIGLVFILGLYYYLSNSSMPL